MKKKFIALVLAFVLCLGVAAVPPVSAASPKSAVEDAKARLAERVRGQATYTVQAAEKIAAIQIGVPDAFINGKKTYIDTKNKKVTPIKKNSKTLVPLRFSAAAMGGKTKYISDKDFITVTLGEKVAKFKINSKQLQIVDSKGKVIQKITLEVAATKVNGRVMVPLRAVSEGLGCKVFYQKIRQDEFVLVSLKKLSAEQKAYSIAQLQNLKTYTFADKTKTYKVKLKGAWDKLDETDGRAAFMNPLYEEDIMMCHVIEAAWAKELVNLPKSELGEDISGYSKTTINGKKAVFFTQSVDIEDEEAGVTETMLMNYCVVSSSKAGVMFIHAGLSNKTGAYSEFKNACKTITMLK